MEHRRWHCTIYHWNTAQCGAKWRCWWPSRKKWQGSQIFPWHVELCYHWYDPHDSQCWSCSQIGYILEDRKHAPLCDNMLVEATEELWMIWDCHDHHDGEFFSHSIRAKTYCTQNNWFLLYDVRSTKRKRLNRGRESDKAVCLTDRTDIINSSDDGNKEATQISHSFFSTMMKPNVDGRNYVISAPYIKPLKIFIHPLSAQKANISFDIIGQIEVNQH